MNLGPVAKLDNKNKKTLKKFYDDVMSANCDVIVIFPIYGQFGAIQTPDSGRIVCKTYIFIKNNLILTSFRQGVILPPAPPLPPPQNEPLKSPPRLGLRKVLAFSFTSFQSLKNTISTKK